ncbi:copper chaperone PCu(A)C [Ilumatobacter sp.]|uniref:copper chaperone PCu(A)C n=1 Tax=Ilumatobacter sp. TaxID=1967498 RepID=UPI003C360896
MKKTNSNISRLAVSAALVAALGLTACGSDDSASTDTTASTDATDEAAETTGVTMNDAWSRQPAEGQTTSAVYGVLTNDTEETLTAVSATSSVSDDVQLHEVIMNDDDTMTMQEKDGGFEVASGESVTFEPGGAHIMLLDIDPATYPDSVDVTLTFDNGTSIEFVAEVRSLDDDAMGDDMDHSEMDESEMTDDTMDHSEMDDSEMDEMEEAPTTDG